MDAETYPSSWLVLLAQLPSKPSSARVVLWRRAAFVNEINRESAAEKYASAEMEESEQDLTTLPAPLVTQQQQLSTQRKTGDGNAR
jgi:hypothetical protein